ncbi:PLC-like phosphodiesterase, partial [Hyaloraphidium curvatum]
CNGFQALCAKRYSEVAVALTHNAYAVGTSISANQNRPLERQLDDGIRGLKLSLLKNPKNADPNEIHLCHGQCGDTTNTIFADAGPMQIYLASIKEWLVANPNEVVTIFLENQQSYPASEIIADFEAADLARLCYAHPDDGTPWPTLRNLTRVQQKQCVVFADRVVVPGQDTVHKSQGWLHAELGFVASNYWLQTVQSAFTCKQHQPYDSGSGALIPRQLFLLNHLMYNNFSATIQVPARNQIATTNSLASIEAHVNDCLATYGRPQVNFVSVDFYEQVDYSVLRVVDALNGV